MTTPALSEPEARALVARYNAVVSAADRTVKDTVRAAFAEVRPLVKAFIDGRGWKALGYASFQECAKPLFDYSRQHLYRLARAAEIERELLEDAKDGAVNLLLVTGDVALSPNGDKQEQHAIEAHLRQLIDPRLKAEARTKAAIIAGDQGRLPTAGDIAQAVRETISAARDADREAVLRSCRWALITQRMNQGKATPAQARAWMDALDALDKQPVLRAAMLKWEVMDPAVIRALAERARRGSETLNEIIASGAMHYADDTFVPLGKATAANVNSYFAEVGQEKRAAGLEVRSGHVLWTGEFIAAGEAGVILTPPGSTEMIAQLAGLPKGVRVTVDLRWAVEDAKGVA